LISPKKYEGRNWKELEAKEKEKKRKETGKK
jgi:hypothetical protein